MPVNLDLKERVLMPMGVDTLASVVPSAAAGYDGYYGQKGSGLSRDELVDRVPGLRKELDEYNEMAVLAGRFAGRGVIDTNMENELIMRREALMLRTGEIREQYVIRQQEMLREIAAMEKSLADNPFRKTNDKVAQLFDDTERNRKDIMATTKALFLAEQKGIRSGEVRLDRLGLSKDEIAAINREPGAEKAPDNVKTISVELLKDRLARLQIDRLPLTYSLVKERSNTPVLEGKQAQNVREYAEPLRTLQAKTDEWMNKAEAIVGPGNPQLRVVAMEMRQMLQTGENRMLSGSFIDAKSLNPYLQWVEPLPADVQRTQAELYLSLPPEKRTQLEALNAELNDSFKRLADLPKVAPTRDDVEYLIEAGVFKRPADLPMSDATLKQKQEQKELDQKRLPDRARAAAMRFASDYADDKKWLSRVFEALDQPEYKTLTQQQREDVLRAVDEFLTQEMTARPAKAGDARDDLREKAMSMKPPVDLSKPRAGKQPAMEEAPKTDPKLAETAYLYLKSKVDDGYDGWQKESREILEDKNWNLTPQQKTEVLKRVEDFLRQKPDAKEMLAAFQKEFKAELAGSGEGGKVGAAAPDGQRAAELQSRAQLLAMALQSNDPAVLSAAVMELGSDPELASLVTSEIGQMNDKSAKISAEKLAANTEPPAVAKPLLGLQTDDKPATPLTPDMERALAAFRSTDESSGRAPLKPRDNSPDNKISLA